MMAFAEEGMLDGQWGIITANAMHSLIIGDAAAVTMERTKGNRLYFGIGFARPNVKVFLPVSPTACIHVLPLVAAEGSPYYSLPPVGVDIG